MKKIITLTFCLSFHLIYAQKGINNLFMPVNTQTSRLSSEFQNLTKDKPSAKLFNLNKEEVSRLYNEPGRYLISIPSEYGDLTIDIQNANPLSYDFHVIDAKGETLDLEIPTFYWGSIMGEERSYVSLTVSSDGIKGIFTSNRFNLEVGKVNRETENRYVLYDTRTSVIDRKIEAPIVLGMDTQDFPEKGFNAQSRIKSTQAGGACRAVEIYIEADYQIYQDLENSKPNVSAYVTNLFSNVAKIYSNEGVVIKLKLLKIWDSPDPYRIKSEAWDIYNEFRKVDFSGTGANLAQLLTSRTNHAIGTYWEDGPPVYGSMKSRASFMTCGRQQVAYSLSGVAPYVYQFPTLSFDTRGTAQALGVNFGLPPTFDCSWPGGSLENCQVPNGYCQAPLDPTANGTIMSSCVDFDLSLGFGFHPGNKLRAEVEAAICLGGNYDSAVDIPVVEDQIRCGSGNVTFIASGCSGGYKWFDDLYGNTSIASGSTFTTPILDKTKDYFVECNISSNCPPVRKNAKAVIECVYCSDVQSYCYSGAVAIHRVGIVDPNGVILDNISGPTCPSEGYTFYTANPINIKAGELYQIQVFGWQGNPNTMGVTAWIDYDGDMEFNNFDELIHVSPPQPFEWVYSNFVVPINAKPGVTRLRVRAAMNEMALSCSPILLGGETEDYLINIISSNPCPSLVNLNSPADDYSSGEVMHMASSLNGTINAQNKISGSADVSYQARAIILNPGFEASSGTVFKAITGGCQ